MTLEQSANELVETWPLPYAATLGSSVRRKGIFLEVRSHLPPAARKSLKVGAGALSLHMSPDHHHEFASARNTVAEVLDGIDSLPILPREIEDILQISSTERHRWLKDGRLPSAGIRTVKLRGRARQVTFHVFDPRVVEDLLDRETVAEWREDDAIAAAENRRRAAWKTRLRRADKQTASADQTAERRVGTASKLLGWEEFERDGPLRQK